MITRLAKKEEMGDIYVLMKDCFGQVFSKDELEIREEYGVQYIIVEKDGKIVAYADFETKEHSLKIYGICVAKDERGKGIGHHLVNTLLDKAKELNKKGIWLYTKKGDKKLLSFYKELGFSELTEIMDKKIMIQLI